MPSSVISGLYDKCIISFTWNWETVQQSGYTIVHSHKQCMKDSVSLHPCQHWYYLFVFLLFNRCVEIHQPAFNLHYSKANGAEHLFIYLYVIWISSSMKCLFMHFYPFFIGWWWWWWWLFAAVDFFFNVYLSIYFFWLVIHFLHISVYMSIPISQFITPPSTAPCCFPPFLSIHLFSTSVSQFLLCKLVHLYHFLGSTYMS